MMLSPPTSLDMGGSSSVAEDKRHDVGRHVPKRKSLGLGNCTDSFGIRACLKDNNTGSIKASVVNAAVNDGY